MSSLTPRSVPIERADAGASTKLVRTLTVGSHVISYRREAYHSPYVNAHNNLATTPPRTGDRTPASNPKLESAFDPRLNSIPSESPSIAAIKRRKEPRGSRPVRNWRLARGRASPRRIDQSAFHVGRIRGSTADGRQDTQPQAGCEKD